MSPVASQNVRQTQAPRITAQTLSHRPTRQAQSCDAAEREQFILDYAPTIKYLAQRLAMRMPASIQLDDLINAGVIGLIDAIEKYDPSRDNLFKTYAEFRIRGAMLDQLRDLDWVPRSVRQKKQALDRAYTSLEQRQGRAATDEETAAFLGLELDELYEWLSQLRGISLLSLEAPGLARQQGDTVNLLDAVVSGASDNPAVIAQERGMRDLLATAIETLSHQEKVVISLYYHEELTMKEIGKVLDITESRVSQIHTKLMLRLRAKIQDLLAI